MRELFAEVHHRPWTATAVAGALAAVCAAAHLPLLAALAAMAAGLILMWISEEEEAVVAAMGTAPAVAPAPALEPPPPIPAAAAAPAETAAPEAVAEAAPAAAAPAADLPVPANDPANAVRDWVSPFPAPRPLRRQHPQGRRARR